MAEVKQLRGSHTVRNMLSRFVLALVIAIPAFGQATQFEYVYGGDCREVGRDVKPVRYCDGDGGYVAVGTTNSYTNYDGSSCLSTTDIYVVRTTESGARIWEYRYDIPVNSSSGDDEGNAIIECTDGSGFVIAGTRVSSSTTSDAILLKIDCNGGTLWAYSYNTGTFDSALDVVEATVGNTGSCAIGDLLVCGTTQQGGNSQLDGLMFRTSSTGALIWSSTITMNFSNESLFSIAEATVPNGNPDVVAAGRTRPLPIGASDGLAVRLNAFNGIITGAPQGVATYGSTNDESFHSVKVLTVGQEATNLVFVGKTNTTTGGGATDIYLVKTAANPCTWITENTIDNSTGAGALNEQGMDIAEESSNPMNLYTAQGFATGDLVVAGTMEVLGSPTNFEMFLLPVDANLRIFAPSGGTTFGDRNPGGTKIENGAALEIIQDTIILCGLSQGNLENDSKVPDPEDLYLVKADNSGATDCDGDWTVVEANYNWGRASCPTVTINTSNTATERDPNRSEIETPNNVCSRPAPCVYCKPAIEPATGPQSGDVEQSL